MLYNQFGASFAQVIAHFTWIIRLRIVPVAAL
jgi:hypothetical protein